jgi:uncharacterized membrane protein
MQHSHREFWLSQMREFLLTTHAQLVIWSTVLLIVIVIAVYIVGRLRDRTDNDRLAANDLLTNFRELHLQGDIEDSEFRDIKSVLGTKLKRELKDEDQPD